MTLKSKKFRAAAPAGLLGPLCLAFSTAWADNLPPASKLPSQSDMPDPLVFLSGDKVTTREQWDSKRRPELKGLFQHYMYGHLPPAPRKIEAKVERTDRKALGGKATLKEITIKIFPEAPPIHLLLVVPNDRKGPAPVFVGMSFCGNHALVDDPAVRLPDAWMYPNHPGVKNNRATEAGRGKQIDVWALEQSIDRGYAVATFYNGDIDPDQAAVRGGIQPYLMKAGLIKDGPDGCATIALWAWGIHRAVDYLVTNKDLDKNRIAV